MFAIHREEEEFHKSKLILSEKPHKCGPPVPRPRPTLAPAEILMPLQFVPESELNLIEQSSSPRKQQSNRGGSMAAEAWKKEIALIYLPLIGEDRCIAPSGLSARCLPSDGDESEKVSSGWRTRRRRARRLGEVARARSMRGGRPSPRSLARSLALTRWRRAESLQR